LARDGWELVVHGRDVRRGAEIVGEIEAEGGRARFVGANLIDLADVGRLAAEAGPVDVLVNNAGVTWFGPSASLDEAAFDGLFASNVRSAYFLVAAVAPGMVERGKGSIINLGSMAAAVGLPGAAAYGATKAALASLTRSWSSEFAPRGVRVNAVAPGPVLSSPDKAERIEALGRTTPLGRPAQVNEIADVIAFLASPAASYLTGSVLAADGGRTSM